MKKTTLLSLIVLSLLTLYIATNVYAAHHEKEAAMIPLQNYLKGHETGNGEYMKKAFHTEGHLMAIRKGKYSTLSFNDFVARVNGGPAEDEPLRKRHVESLDIFGDAAVGKIVLDYPKVLITDYMSMLKIDGEWKIVNKTYSVRPKDQ